MNRMTLAGTAFVALLTLSTPALAQTSQCEGNGQQTQATCDGDACSCAAACTRSDQCFSGCCSGGFCALDCVCAGQGTVNTDCGNGGGCVFGGGTIAPTASPLAGGMAMLWGFALIGVGVVASARFMRRGGLRSPAGVAALSVALLGAAFVTATAFERAPISQAKGLVQR